MWIGWSMCKIMYCWKEMWRGLRNDLGGRMYLIRIRIIFSCEVKDGSKIVGIVKWIKRFL